MDSDLNVTLKIIKPVSEESYETWEETVNRLSEEINKKANESMDLIRDAFDRYSEYEFFSLTSTGKDSTVVVDLVDRVKKTQVVFNNTSLDCAGTYKMAKSHDDWIITNPDEGFYQWVKRINFVPTRFGRGCCRIFKEGNHVNYFKDRNPKALWFMGIRNDESNNRADRQDYTVNPKWEGSDWIGCLPIRKWSEFEVWLYILQRNLEINPKYKEGYARVGCAIACPYASKYTWVLDDYFYPKMRQRWVNILNESFVNDEKWIRVNCTKDEYVKCWNGGLYREEPTEEVVEEFRKHKNIDDINVARQYFNKSCCVCEKSIKQNDVLAMNLKLIDRNTEKLYCKKHLKEKFGINEDQYKKSIEDFKAEGCTLF